MHGENLKLKYFSYLH